MDKKIKKKFISKTMVKCNEDVICYACSEVVLC